MQNPSEEDEEEVSDDEPSPENPEEEVFDEHPDDVVRIEITLTNVKDDVIRSLLWEEQYITEALARVMWDGGIMDGSIERVSTRVRSMMDLHLRSPSWVFTALADLFVEFVLKQVSRRNTGDRTLEIITKPAAGPCDGCDELYLFDLMERVEGSEGNKSIQWYCEDCKSEDEEESSDEPVDEPEPKPKPVKNFETVVLHKVRYLHHLATGGVYIIHKDADGKDDSAKREPLGTLVDKKIRWTKKGGVQHKVARSFMNKEIITSNAKHPDGQDLDMYKMSFFGCNAEVPIVGEEFYIKMGGVRVRP